MANPTNPPAPTPNQPPTPPPAPQPAPQQIPAQSRAKKEKWIAVGILVGVLLLLVSLISNAILSSRAKWLDDQNTDLWREIKWRRFEETNRRPTTATTSTTNTSDLTRVPVEKADTVVTEASTPSVSAEKNHKEGVSVNQSTNGVAIKVVADKDSRVSVNIRSDKDTEQSQNPVHNAHRVVELDATDGRLDTVTGIYKLTNTVYALEKVLFQIPEGWSMQAHTAYPHGMLKVLDEKGNPLGGKSVSGGCMFVQNLSQTIDVKLRWECMKIPMTNK